MSCVWFNAQTVSLEHPKSVYNKDGVGAGRAAKMHTLAKHHLQYIVHKIIEKFEIFDNC